MKLLGLHWWVWALAVYLVWAWLNKKQNVPGDTGLGLSKYMSIFYWILPHTDASGAIDPNSIGER